MSRTLNLAMGAVLAASPMVLAAPSAEAAPSASKYKNCAALNRVYSSGVGKKGAVDKTRGVPKPLATRVRNFRVDTKLYNSLPRTLDRDRDGIACEKLVKSAPAKPKPKPSPAKPKPKPSPAKPKQVPVKAAAKGKTVSSLGGFAFVTPSGNVTCVAGPTDVRCDISEFAYVPPTPPRSCDLDYGQTFELRRSAALGCVGDTVAGSAHPSQNWFRKTGLKPVASWAGPQAVLPYGWKLNSTQISCTSATTGVTCTNTTTRHGFTVAKAGYKIF